ncbi:MAG: hypothetical protein ACLTDR_06320 [Adlercreutzia equolifaciens]
MEASERTRRRCSSSGTGSCWTTEGLGPAAYDEMLAGYDIPEDDDAGGRRLHVAGHAAPTWSDCDLIPSRWTPWTARATRQAPCTVSSRTPWRATRGPEASLHDCRLVDLFGAAYAHGL